MFFNMTVVSRSRLLSFDWMFFRWTTHTQTHTHTHTHTHIAYTNSAAFQSLLLWDPLYWMTNQQISWRIV